MYSILSSTLCNIFLKRLKALRRNIIHACENIAAHLVWHIDIIEFSSSPTFSTSPSTTTTSNPLYHPFDVRAGKTEYVYMEPLVGNTINIECHDIACSQKIIVQLSSRQYPFL